MFLITKSRRNNNQSIESRAESQTNYQNDNANKSKKQKADQQSPLWEPSRVHFAFAAAASKLWNSLPCELCSNSNLENLKEGIKTFLFAKAYVMHTFRYPTDDQLLISF